MKKKNIMIILIILIIILSIYISSLDNNKDEIKNNSVHNTTKINSNMSDDNLLKNNTINNTSDHLNETYYSNDNKHSYYDDQVHNSSDEALMAKKMVEKYALNKNEIAKYPTFKDRGMWLIPIFDKNTGKFTGSVFADDQGSIFINGPNTYSEYKKIVNSKKVKHNSKDPIKKSKYNKSNKQTKNNKLKNNKSNKSKTNNKVSNTSTYNSNLNQQKSLIESNGTNF